MLDSSEGWFCGEFGADGSAFTVEASRDPKPRIRMHPLDEALRKTIAAITLEFAADLASVDQLTIADPQGNRTVMRFRVRRRAAPIPEGAFSTKDPLPLAAARASAEPECPR